MPSVVSIALQQMTNAQTTTFASPLTEEMCMQGIKEDD